MRGREGSVKFCRRRMKIGGSVEAKEHGRHNGMWGSYFGEKGVLPRDESYEAWNEGRSEIGKTEKESSAFDSARESASCLPRVFE